MTCTYDFRWRHIYVKCPITSGSHILDPQNPIFSFRHNFTKKYFFSKVRLIPDSAWSDLPKEPIKSGYLCKNTKKIRFSVTTGPIRQVHYTEEAQGVFTKTSSPLVTSFKVGASLFLIFLFDFFEFFCLSIVAPFMLFDLQKRASNNRWSACWPPRPPRIYSAPPNGVLHHLMREFTSEL